MTQQPDPIEGHEDDEAEILIEEPDADDSLDGEADEPIVLPDGLELDIDAAQQARIDLLHDDLQEKSFYDLLEVRRDAPIKTIKRAYYRLSREFHPDRFFRKELGPYKAKLERVFAQLNAAYRVLSDDQLRDDYDAELFGGTNAQTGQVSMATREVTFATRRKLAGTHTAQQVKRKKKKAPLPPHLLKAKEQLVERLRKARKAYLKGQQLFERGEFEKAGKLFQRAMMLDPKNADAADKFRLSLEKGRNTKAEEHWRRGQEALQREQHQEAASHFRDAVNCKPTIGKYYFSFGKLVWDQTMRHRSAIELLRTAVEKDPNRLEYLIELGLAYEGVGMPTSAIKAFERANQIDPSHPEVKKGLKRLR